MKIKFEYNRLKIRNKQALDSALFMLTIESKQGFFKSKDESYFKKFNHNSLIEDSKLIEIYVPKIVEKGCYKLNGNLSFNQKTQQIKFYILSVNNLNKFKYDKNNMVEFFNKSNSGIVEDIQELTKIIKIIKKTKLAEDNKKEKIKKYNYKKIKF